VSSNLHLVVAALAAPQTIRIRLDANQQTTGKNTLDANTVANFCSSEPSGKYAATKINASPQYIICDFTFPANVSFVGDIPFVVNAVEGTGFVEPKILVQNTTLATPSNIVPVDKVQIVSAPTLDLQFGVRSSNLKPTTTEVSGVRYLKYEYLLGISSPPYARNFSFTKGNRSIWGNTINSTYSGPISINTNWPTGTIVTQLYPYESPTTSTYNDATKTIDINLNWPGSTYYYANDGIDFGQGRVYYSVLIPIPSVDTDFKTNIVSSDITTTGMTYTRPFNGQLDEPGTGQPETFSTANYNNLSTFAGNTTPNNNYSKVKYVVQPPAGTLLTKTLSLPDGREESDFPAVTVKPDSELIAHLSLSPYNAIADRVVICDDLINYGTAGQVAPDTTKAPSVRYWDLYGNQTNLILNTDFTVQYSANACGDPGSNIGWSSTPVPNTRSIRAVLLNRDMASSNSRVLAFDIPLKSGSIDKFPGIGTGGKTIADQPYVSLSSSDTSMTWGNVTRYFRVIPDLVSSTSFANLSVNGAFPSSVAAGLKIDAISNSRAIPSYSPSDVKLEKIVTISSCALSPNFSGATGVINKWDSLVVTPANPGPDGILCTADDVSDWSAVYTWNNVKQNYTSGDSRDLSVSFVLAPYAKNTNTITTTTTTNIYPNDPNVANATSFSSRTLGITVPGVVGQTKIQKNYRELAGTDIGWELYHFNNTNTTVSDFETIDVLPYDGDARGTKLKSPLTNVRIEKAGYGLTSGDMNIYVTKDPPSAINTNTAHPSNDPSNTAQWCLLDSAACPQGGKLHGDLYSFQQSSKRKSIGCYGYGLHRWNNGWRPSCQ